MKLILHWFGESDAVRLDQIRQVPCLVGVGSDFEEIPIGEVWPVEKLAALRERVESFGLSLEVIESIPVHETIKVGLPERDQFIESFARSVENIGKVGIKTLCYNFMPVLGWMRTDLKKVLPDGSSVSAYSARELQNYDLSQGFEQRTAWRSALSGDAFQAALKQYEHIDEEALFENYAYFLRCIVPVAESAGVFMAVHPDDPPWPMFGVPRIVRDAASIQRILDVVDSPHHGITFCTGSLGAALDNDLPAMVRQFAGRINFVHMRNVKVTDEKEFYEVAHPTECGSVDMAAVMEALVDIGYNGPARPDHGRRIWDENVTRVGYGLYDRSLGAMYLHGLYQGIKQAKAVRQNS
jgi:mannonate dehydratase